MNQNGMMECLRHGGPWEAIWFALLPTEPSCAIQTHENILPFENSVFQDSSASKQMLADFLNSVPVPGYELLLAERHFSVCFSFISFGIFLLFPTLAFVMGHPWKVTNCLELCSRWDPSFSPHHFFSLCCQSVFGYLSSNFFLTWNHLFITSSSWLTTALFIVAKYWK